jgi:hydrogenase-4 component F
MVGASLAKTALFLAAGNILIGFGTKRTREVTGLLRALPATGALFVAGLFAISGAPPFALFPCELALLAGAIEARQLWIAVAMVLLQAVAFMGMGSAVLGMALGARSPAPARAEAEPPAPSEDRWRLLPPFGLLALALLLGLHVPAGVHRALAAAAHLLGGHQP